MDLTAEPNKLQRKGITIGTPATEAFIGGWIPALAVEQGASLYLDVIIYSIVRIDMSESDRQLWLKRFLAKHYN